MLPPPLAIEKVDRLHDTENLGCYGNGDGTGPAAAARSTSLKGGVGE
jgi:hypothetical protein